MNNSDSVEGLRSMVGEMNVRSAVTGLLWLAVPFPTYCALVLLAQPTMHELLVGAPMGTVPMYAMTWKTVVLGLSAACAIVLVGGLVAFTSWEFAKDSVYSE